MSRSLLIGGLALAGLAATLMFAATFRGASAEVVTLRAEDATVVAQGQDIYATECAACHGADLEGQPNWRARDADGLLPAPPHDATGHTWHHDGDSLFRIVKLGLPELIGDPDYATAMPAYEGVLTDDEIVAVLSYIKSTWPAEIRAAHDAKVPSP
ncbi:c-type cytochrome [Jannaschia donghaensis]|uniref:Putative bifunctional cbb3-type cytochrome c oxidase subunit II/cytochrome c n=1 Tax=Jannaschia donghaensis TaxID=420998 RepID=A0A0M6YFV4_9RHOB|nr:cytochrome c [Jannaschia donghaensis]CTQ48545.1 putative bifunctional cbb3-type cytochrome c oxidase subunit II/cytochrome c [Jannaschia donghaensis]